MQLGIRKSFKIFAPGSSLRRRVGYSLALVRVILVPVILLAIYYLFQMGAIVDRIVAVDAPAATIAEQVSAQMLEARRSERNYFLLHDPTYLQANREALGQVKQSIGEIARLEPSEQTATREAIEGASLYERQFAAAVSLLDKPEDTPLQRVQQVITAYEQDLNDLLRQARQKRRDQLIEELRSRVDSFDAEIARMGGGADPTLRRVTPDLQAASQQVLRIASESEARSWARVQRDHQDARRLIYRAEWVLSIISGLTFLLSIWISFVLPRQVVKPLVSLREAVEHAASGNYQIEFQLQGEGEVVELAKSIRNLIGHVRQTVSVKPAPSA
jgi:CHASE3 domain sensor protein